MQLLKIQVKVFAQQDREVDEYVSVFHRWIRDNVIDELLIDVVDYTHVADGPSVALIGHHSDYVLDKAAGRLGLLYVNKRAPECRVAQALTRAFNAAQLLERETEPKHRLTFRADELSLRVADRLNAPNTDDTYERLLPELSAALEPLYGASGFELSRVGAENELFSVTLRAPKADAFAEIAARATRSSG